MGRGCRVFMAKGEYIVFRVLCLVRGKAGIACLFELPRDKKGINAPTPSSLPPTISGEKTL